MAQQKPQKALKAIKAIYENNSQYEQWLYRDLLFAGACLADSPKGMKVKDKEGLANEIIHALIDLEIKDNLTTGKTLHNHVFKIMSSLVETDWEGKTFKLLEEKEKKILKNRFIQY